MIPELARLVEASEKIRHIHYEYGHVGDFAACEVPICFIAAAVPGLVAVVEAAERVMDCCLVRTPVYHDLDAALAALRAGGREAG